MRGSGLAGARILMAPNLGHGAGVTGTATRRPHKNGNYVVKVGSTHVDSANPLCLFLSTECSPFFAYSWLNAGGRFTSARHGDRRPENGQGDRKESEDEHG